MRVRSRFLGSSPKLGLRPQQGGTLNKQRESRLLAGEFRCALLLVPLVLGLAMLARGQDCTKDRPTPPSIGGGRGPDAAYKQAYQSWCERHGGNYNSIEVSCDPGPNWCKSNDTSSNSGTQDISSGLANALATAIISGNAQTRGTAFGIIGTLFLLKELTSEDSTPAPVIAPNQAEIDRAREIEAARQRWRSLVEELNRNMKSTGPPITDLRFKGLAVALGGDLKSVGSQIPELQLKDVSGARSVDTLQFKSIDAGGVSNPGYGIPGLPGIYVGGPRDANAQSAGVQGLPGLYLKNTQESTQTLPNGGVIQPGTSSPSSTVASAPSSASTNVTQPGSAVPGQSGINAPSGTEPRATSTVEASRPITPQLSPGAQQTNSAVVGQTDEAASEQARNDFENAAANIGFSPTKPTQAPAATISSVDTSVVDLHGGKQQSPTVSRHELPSPRTATEPTGEGKSNSETGMTHGQPATSQLLSPADICAQIPKAQNDFIEYSQEIAKDRAEIRSFGFDKNVDDIESWEKYGEDAKREWKKAAIQGVLAKALDALANAAGELAQTHKVTRTQAVYLKQAFGRADKNLSKELDQAIDRANAAGSDIVNLERIDVGKFAEAAHEVQRSIDVIPDGGTAREVLDSTLSAAELAAQVLYPPAVPALEAAKDANWLGYLAFSAGKATLGVHDVSKLTELTEDQLRELRRVTDKLKADVDAVNRAKRVLAQASALPADKSCDSTRLVKMPN